MRKAYRAVINVSKTIFETQYKTLSRYPETLLGSKQKRRKYYDPQKKQYFFNCDYRSFDNILFFYQSFGILCRPLDIELEQFIELCIFFELPAWAIESVKIKEGGDMQRLIYNLYHPILIHQTKLRFKILDFIEKPSKKERSFWLLSLFHIFLKFLSIVVLCLMNTRELRSILFGELYRKMMIVDHSISFYFLFHWLLRLLLHRDKFNFMKGVGNWIDLLALVPLVLQLANVKVLQSFQIFRIFRLYWLSKMFTGLQLILIVVKKSLRDIKLIVLSLILVTTFTGSIAYIIEHSQPETTFYSIPQGIYWAIQTSLTIGYGDIVPKTFFGKIFSSFFMALSIPIIGIPVISVFANCHPLIKDNYDY